MLMADIQFTIRRHAAGIDIRRAQRHEHIVNNHQLRVHIHMLPFSGWGIRRDQRADVDFQAGDF
ncbi:hypothetical protein D3C81_2285190 [compost metagenome]